MRAMILAAGRGERMRPLTDHCPKPLLRVGDRPLIVWHLLRLGQAGLREIVINHSHLGDQLIASLGDGAAFGVTITWSAEPVALETAGGIARACPLLGSAPFLVVNGDIWTDYDFSSARELARRLDDDGLDAWCVLVPNPAHHPDGDFGIAAQRLSNQAQPRMTFSGIGVYRPEFFGGVAPGAAAPLGPLLRSGADAGRIGAEVHAGAWTDVGTPQRLAELDNQLTTEN